MANPFANAPHHTSGLSGAYLFGIQTGQKTYEQGGIDQMMYITLEQLTAYVRGTFGNLWNYRGEYSSALPTNLAVNDYFLATGNFTSGGMSFESGHLYAYNGSVWSDITDPLARYATSEEVTGINDRLEIAEAQIQAFSGGIVPKGEVATEADLPTASDSNKGWMYFVTDLGKYQVSDGTQWVDFGNYPIEAYYLRSSFPATGAERTLYIAYDEKKVYWWNGSSYVSEIDDLLDGTKTAKKAEQDASGNVITTTYATKAELQNEVSTISTRLTKAEKQIENLNQAEGDYSVTDYQNAPSGVVPSGKASYGVMKYVEGVSRGWNQMLSGLTDFSVNDGATASISATTRSATVTVLSASGSNRIQTTSVSFVAGHKYMVVFNAKADVSTSMRLEENSSSAFYTATSTTSLASYSAIFTANGGSNFRIYYDRSSVLSANGTFTIEDLCLYDLTLLGASDTSSVSTVLTQFPQLGQYNGYNPGSLVSTRISGIRSKSRNLAQKNPVYMNADNIPTFDASNCIKIKANVQYYWRIFEKTFSTYRFRIYFYDTEGNPLPNPSTSWITEQTSNSLFKSYEGLVFGADTGIFSNKWTFNNNYYIRLVFLAGNTSSSSLITQFCFNVSDADDGTYTAWFDPVTLPLTETTLRSAGSVHERLTLETGEVTHPTRRYQIKDLSWTPVANSGGTVYSMTSTTLSGVIKNASSDDAIPDVSCAFFAPISRNQQYSSKVGIAVRNGTVYIYDPNHNTSSSASAFVSDLGEVYIDFALITPDASTYITAITDNLLLTESGGTVETIQTQTPQIDTRFGVGYMAI